MFVLTADQVGSRHSPDAVDGALETIRTVGGRRLALAPERTVGDEVQVATRDARCLLDLVLALIRLNNWSVGCGVGEIESNRVSSVRAARGTAFIAARDAVEAAKKRPLRFALRGPDDRLADAGDAQALIDLLLALRARRTDEGWEVFDLIAAGQSQKSAATSLGISEQAVSLRVRTALVAAELDALPALVRTLERVERDDRGNR
jgi:hypothetical protein